MRIAVIHLGFFYAGGGERLVLEEVRGLRQLGHEVECYAPFVDARSCYPELISEVGVHRLVPNPPSWLPARVALCVLLSCILAPLLAFRFRRFDVLFAANQPAPWIAWVVARMLGKPYVAYLAQPNRVLYPRPIDLKERRPNLDYRAFAAAARLMRPLVMWADRVSVAGAAAVLANGTYMVGVLESVYRRRMISCPAGSYAAPSVEFDFRARRDGVLTVGTARIAKPYVLLTNRHFPQKRFDYAIRAMRRIPGSTLVITGARTAYTSAMEQLATDLGVHERVIFTGLVSEDDLVRLYRGAAVYVYPAPEEDYGMGIVEAMGHGVPTVAWRSAGPTSTVHDGKTGFLVEPFKEEEFAQRIELLLRSSELAERIGRAAWLQVNNSLGYPSHFKKVEAELVRASAKRVPARPRVPWLRPALQSLFGLALLALWMRTVPLRDLGQQLRPHHLAPLAAIAGLGILSAWLRAWRWSRLLRPFARMRIQDVFWINAGSGLLNYIVPIRAGDASRLLWINRRESIPAGSGLATIVVDKAFDLGAIVGALCLTFLVSRSVGLAAAAIGAAGLFALLVTLAVLGPHLADSGLLGQLLPRHWSSAIAAQVFSFRAGIRGSMTRSRLPALAALSLAAIIVDGIAFSLLFQALDIKVPLALAFVAYAALLLTYALPGAPGYVGSLELAGSLVLGGGLGLSRATAAGAILLWHALSAVMILALGLLGLQRLALPRVGAERPRRIAVFHCSFTYSGGGERIVLEEVFGLRRHGYEVECFAPTVDTRACYPDLIGRVRPKTFLPQLPAWMPLREAIQMVACSVLVPLYAWRFRSFDVIVGANQPGAWIAWYAAQLLGKPYLVYLNQPNRLVYPRPIDLKTGWQTRPDYHLLNAVIQRTRGFVAWADGHSIGEARQLLVNGHYIGDIIRKTYRREAVDCPAGCHVEEGYPRPVADRFAGRLRVNGFEIRKPYVLLTNRHYPQKRFDLAISAMVSVRRAHPGTQLLIPGPATTHTVELRHLVRKLDLEDAVLFLGEISELDLQSLYAQAAVYVYPAPEEDFGMGVIEAMAKGVPVVSWNQAGPTVTVAPGETGYLAIPGDVADYACGIAAYLADPEANQQAGVRGHARARLFSWERHVDILDAAIARAMELDERQRQRGALPLVEVKEVAS